MKALFDTNILIDYLSGIEAADEDYCPFLEHLAEQSVKQVVLMHAFCP